MERTKFRLKEVAEILGLHTESIRLNIKSGVLTAEKIGKEWFIKKTDLLKFLATDYDILTEQQRSWYDRETGGDIEESIRKILRRTIETGVTAESDKKELFELKQQLLMLYSGNVPMWIAKLAKLTAQEASKKAGQKINIDITLGVAEDGKIFGTVEERIDSIDKKGN